jgi:hypothetical protein
MAKKTSPLQGLHVASPCSANWDEMWGNDRVRFCGHCNLNVYNLSGMSKAEAEYVVASAEGRLCARFYRRKDGTILTQDCPVGLAAFKQRVNQIGVAAISSVLSLFASFGAMSLFGGKSTVSTPQVMGVIAVPVETLPPEYHEAVAGQISAPPQPPYPVTMGDVEVKPAPKTQYRER